MRLSIGVTSGMELRQILKLAQAAQEGGLNRVWVGDDLTLFHDVFTVASTVALKFPEMHVGIGITSPLLRNVSTIARASASLSEITGPDRFRLGLGIGGLQDLKKLGITASNPQETLNAAISLLKRIWQGGTVLFSRGAFDLNGYAPKYRMKHRIPIFLGVRGPKLLRLAGELADGVILSGPKRYIEKAIALVRTGFEKRGEAEKDFEFVVWVPTVLAESHSDLNLVKRTVAFVLADTPDAVLEMGDLGQERVRHVRRVYQIKGIAQASELVTDDLLNEVSIYGDPERICTDASSLAKLGVQEVVFGPPYGTDAAAATAAVAKAWRTPS